jgi:transposase
MLGGAYEGKPHARQCADRFHLVQNLREAVEQQLYRRSAGEMEDSLEDDGTERTRAARRSIREAKFEQVRQLSEQGLSTIAICRATRLHVRTVKAWRQLKQLPERYRMEPKLCTPAYFHEPLREAWDCGVTRGRALFALIQGLGYTGSRSHLARYLAPWRSGGRCPRASDAPQPSSMTRERPETKIPPVAGAALCMAFRGTLSRRQQDALDRVTAASPQFAAMRKLAMNFRAILFGADPARLDAWLTEANASGPYHIRSFARWLIRDLQAVRNAITEPWNNGQTEGQINKLKILKRSMYGRAGVDLLRARLIRIEGLSVH